MRTYHQCLICFERQAANACGMAGLSSETTEEILARVREMTSVYPVDLPPINMAVQIHDLIRERSGNQDPYADIKKRSNTAAHACTAILTQSLAWSLNPMLTALQIAIAGNIIDCGASELRDISKRDLVNVIQDALKNPLYGDSVERFVQIVEKAERILFLGDNAGECFFDRLLLEQLPLEKLSYAVRGGPILNDATLADAVCAGIPPLCPVVDTGDNAPGIIWDRCSGAFRDMFESSDLIIAKGQGNYESLSGSESRTTIYLTKVKCDVVARDIGHALGSSVMKICPSRQEDVPQGENEREVVAATQR